MTIKNLDFFIVDVFAEEKFAGNQLAVFLDAEELSDVEMQKIAKEMHFSETTFILSRKKQDQGFNVRIFTPENEVPFAGHPTLGTAYIIQREIIKETMETLLLNLKVGQIPVSFKHDKDLREILWMKQNIPTFDQEFARKEISEILKIQENDIDERFPIQDVSTGLPFIIIPIKTLKAIKKAKIETDKYLEFIKKTRAKALLLFCPQTYHKDNDLNVRMFAEYYGVPEDPATGSGNGCLAGYLVKYRYFNKSEINIRVEQGYEIGRSSLLFLRAKNQEGQIHVHVGGCVVMVAKCKLM